MSRADRSWVPSWIKGAILESKDRTGAPSDDEMRAKKKAECARIQDMYDNFFHPLDLGPQSIDFATEADLKSDPTIQAIFKAVRDYNKSARPGFYPKEVILSDAVSNEGIVRKPRHASAFSRSRQLLVASSRAEFILSYDPVQDRLSAHINLLYFDARGSATKVLLVEQ